MVGLGVIKKWIMKAGFEGVDWIQLAHDRVHLGAPVNTTLNKRSHEIWAVSWPNERVAASQMDSVPWTFPSRLLVPSYQINSSISLQWNKNYELLSSVSFNKHKVSNRICNQLCLWCSHENSTIRAGEFHLLSLSDENPNKLQISCGHTLWFYVLKSDPKPWSPAYEAEMLTSAAYRAVI
jgi:hypothetical protein